MLKLELITHANPQRFFNPFYLRKSIGEGEFSDFISYIKFYKATLESAKEQNEDFLVANALKTLFYRLGFEAHAKYKQQGKSEIDLVLTKDNEVQVIIEVKKPQNQEIGESKKDKEMLSEQNPNAKALHEAILYYFHQREISHNPNIKHIIITDCKKFYIFKASSFKQLFYDNKDINKQYQALKNQNKNINTTADFYASVERILDSSDFNLGGFYIDLDCISFISDSANHQSYKQLLSLLFRVFHRDFLLDEFNPNDANVLNEKFYRELLYILGLSEVDKKGREINEVSKNASKILIKPSKESQNGANTLYNAIITNLSQEKKDFDFAMHFVILWLNRILFLKLIEANLVRFNDDKNLKFLTPSKVPNFKTLSHLFFEILAKKPEQRSQANQINNQSNIHFLPYLNSSLFERQAYEEVLDIAALSNSAMLEYFPHTQIKDKNAKPKAGKARLLEYLFEFLDAFDFGSDEYNDEIVAQKDLISSSVLGLVFEKLNGYKEGSFYTPSFITSYMCKESLSKVILQKFREIGLNAQDLESLATQILMNINVDFGFRSKALEVLRSVKICDPSVGSGHFLVSALCEMIRIYRTLGLVENELNACEISVRNDEIYVSQNGVAFAYQRLNNQNHKIQKSLFHLKKSIIENNLFGVDINPNSVEICKLRLWIELLKNSYYLTQASEGFDERLPESYHQMQTLPNIDINIKCGNSLISRFSLQDSLRHIPNIDKQIKDYQKLVLDYKHSDQSELKASKKDIESKILNLKETFKLTLKDPKTKASLEKAIKNHIRDFGMFMLDDESLLDGIGGYIGNLFDDKNLSDEEQKQASASYANIKYLRHKLDSALSGEEYKNAFEWRFEFPEVLDSNGDFMGFDLIIGNPPYIDYREINASTILITKKYAVNEDSTRPNIFCYFIERGIENLSKNGILSFINPIAMLQADFAYGARKILLEKGCIEYVADCSYIKVFDSASTYPTLWKFTNNKKQGKIKVVLWQDDKFVYSHNIDSYERNERLSINIAKREVNFKRVDCQTLGEIGTLKWGTSQSGYGKKKILLKKFKRLNQSKQECYKPIIQTADIKRYSIVWQKEYIPTEIYSQNIQEDFKKPKIVIARMTKNIQATFDKSGFYMGKATLIVDYKENPYYILGILNSKVANFWYKYYFGATHLASGYIRYDIPYLKQLPIPKLTTKNKKITDEITTLVTKILEYKKQGKDTGDLESKIDDLVYQLYELTQDEIKIIESNQTITATNP